MIEGGLWGEVRVGGVRRGRPTGLLYPTPRGKDLLRALGLKLEHGYEELLRRHGSPKGVLLALLARDKLQSWEDCREFPDLWAEEVQTPAGRSITPDLVATVMRFNDAQDDNWDENLYVRLRVDPCPSECKWNPELVGTWQAYHELNDRCLYVVVPGKAHEELVIREVRQWQAIARIGATLYTTNVTQPGPTWRKTVLPWFG